MENKICDDNILITQASPRSVILSHICSYTLEKLYVAKATI